MCVWFLAAGLATGPGTAAGENTTEYTHFLRGGYQYGLPLGTNDFLRGDNLSGEPIDSFQAARLEFGWQTDGSMDWHHQYNFPSFGVGFYGAEYFNGAELGEPAALYGFFSWPPKRWPPRWQWNIDLGLGLSGNWNPFDSVTNPKNTAMGSAYSIYIDVGTTFEYRLARHWSLLGGVALTHFSNGGFVQPNLGLNQIAPIIYAKYRFEDWKAPVKRTDFAPFEPFWKFGVTGSVGVRNIAHNTAGLSNPENTVYNDYFIGTALLSGLRQISRVTCLTTGLEITYDESVGDLVELEGLRAGVDQVASALDFWSLGVFGGFEGVVDRTRFLVQLGYTILRRDVDAQVPRLLQRLGLRYYVWDPVSAGLTIRFYDFSRANNLEFSVGYWFGS